MSNRNLLPEVKCTRVANAASNAQTEIDGSIIDMANYDGVMFVALLNSVTDGCVLTLVAQQNTANQTSGMAAITGATTGAITAASSSNMVMMLDVYRPQQEFVRPVLTRTAQNAQLDGIIAIQYRGNKRPSVQDAATVLASAFAVGV